MPSNITYPWFFFYRIAKLSFLVFLPTLFITLFFYRSFYKDALVSHATLQTEENLRIIKSSLELSKVDLSKWCQSFSSKNSRGSVLNRNSEVICETSPVNNELVLRTKASLDHIENELKLLDRFIFFRIVPFALLSFLIYLYLIYQTTKPLAAVLEKVKKFKIDIPFNKNLELLYKKDEWSNITEALSEADFQLKNQVTNIQNENEKIAAILESISDNIIAVDPYETILFYNTKFKRNFMKEKTTHEIIPKLWHTISDEDVTAAFKSVLKHGEAKSLKSLSFPSSQVPDRFFDLAITSLRNSEGKISGALGVLYDITDFKLTEQMRVNFVANVSHEIRTPLTSIKGYTQLLDAQKEKIDPELHLFLEKIMSNTERMISLFNDLLSLSVIESKNIIKFEELDLDELIRSVGSNIKTNYPLKDVSISYDIKLPLLRGDAKLMEQVLSNLIDNACKYAGETISINISTFSEKNKGYIAVADNGLGISKEHIQRIFERFYRVDSSRETSRGAGLGLSIVKHIVAKHGGRIWAESAEKDGSNFVIELPLS